jgi:hypothetical protein
MAAPCIHICKLFCRNSVCRLHGCSPVNGRIEGAYVPNASWRDLPTVPMIGQVVGQICARDRPQARGSTTREPEPSGNDADDCPNGHDRNGRPCGCSSDYDANDGSRGGTSDDFDDANDDFGGSNVDRGRANTGPALARPAYRPVRSPYLRLEQAPEVLGRPVRARRARAV